MEPLHRYDGEYYEEEHIKPHIVYRKDARKGPKEDASLCDTTGTKITFKFFSIFFLDCILFLKIKYGVKSRHLLGVLHLVQVSQMSFINMSLMTTAISIAFCFVC